MAEILRRSGDSALTLSLDCKHIRWNNAQESIPFLTVVASHTARRATSLTLIDMDYNVMKELYLVLERLDLPVFPSTNELKVAPIFDDRSPNNFNDPTPVSVLARRMTNVTALLLGDEKTCLGASFNQHIFYPWSQFCSIVLLKYSLSIGEALQVLSETRGLHTFKAQIVTIDLMGHTNWDPEPGSVRLPMLENLDIVYDQDGAGDVRPDGVVLRTLLSPLLVPRLSKLKISSVKSGGKYSLIRMTDGANVANHLCTLKSLTSLELVGCADVDVDLLLRDLPRLQHLAAWHLVKSSGLLRQSVSALASREYGINLQSLRCRLSSADIMPFIAMLEQQWTSSQVASSNTCLVRAEIFVGWDGQSVARLNEMVRELKQRMGVNFPVEFLSLLDVSADPSDHDESDYNSYF